MMRRSTVTHVSWQRPVFFCIMPFMLLPIRSVVLAIQVVALNLNHFCVLTPVFAVSLDNMRIHLHDRVNLVLFTHIPVIIDLRGFQLFRNYANWRLNRLIVLGSRLALL